MRLSTALPPLTTMPEKAAVAVMLPALVDGRDDRRRRVRGNGKAHDVGTAIGKIQRGRVAALAID